MKFEKHLKNTGIYGVIFTAKNGDKYLRTGKNGNVLARIPAGFAPIGDLVTHDLETWIDEILIGGADDLIESKLIAAKLEKDGKAKDIRRVWGIMLPDGTVTGHRCEIDNAAFGLIERGDDVRIFDPRIDVEESELFEDLEPIDEPDEEIEKRHAGSRHSRSRSESRRYHSRTAVDRMTAVLIVMLGIALIASLAARCTEEFEEVQEDAENEK